MTEHDEASHDHAHAGRGAHSHSHSHDLRGTQRTALVVSIGANLLLLIAQVVVGLAVGSLALLADSLHNASDVVALVIALIGQGLAARPATARQSYGLARTEILAALLNSAVLLALTGWVVVEAIGRFSNPTEIKPAPLAIIGVLGLAVNGGSAWYLRRSGGENLNIRAAFWHLAADALGSFGVVLAAVAVWAFDATWADPAVSILISILIGIGVVQLLKDTVLVLLEATPSGIDPVEVTSALGTLEGVTSVHHLHIWAIDSQSTALTAHLELEDGTDLHRAQETADDARTLLAERFGISHATLEPECHECEAPAHEIAPG
jgi:cobalt-zinc-cadmium efflux system protein